MSTPAVSDEHEQTLMRQAAKGDNDAVAHLMGKHLGAVTAWLKKSLPPGEAEDLAHDVFLPSRLVAYSGESSARGYLIGVAKNLLLHRQRDAARQTARGVHSLEALAEAGHEPALSATSALVASDEVEFLQAVTRKVFAQLSPTETRVFELRYHEGLEFAEIARRLGASSENTVRSLHRRALTRLRETMAAWMNHPSQNT